MDAEFERLGREHVGRIEKEKAVRERRAELDAICLARGKHSWYMGLPGTRDVTCKKCGRSVEDAIEIPGESWRPKNLGYIFQGVYEVRQGKPLPIDE